MLPVTKKGQGTSVNTLMDALEMLGQRLTKETIQERLLNSGKYYVGKMMDFVDRPEYGSQL